MLLSWQCVLLCGVATADIISVIKDSQGNFQVKEDIVDGWIVRANFTDSFATVGWNFLDIEGNEFAENRDVAVSAGLAEGYLTSTLILQYHREFLEKSFCWKDPTFCAWVKDILKSNKDWVMDMIELHPNSDYWKMVSLFYSQLEGLEMGIRQKIDFGLPKFNMKLDLNAVVMMSNFYPDIGDLTEKYKSENIQVSRPSCSVLIKKTVNDIVTSHATWHEYRAIPFRIMKRYILKYDRTERGRIPGHTISMSSYAGLIYSLDDFYQISSGLSVAETTLPVYGSSLFQLVDPRRQIFTPVRAMVSNRLSSSGRDWCELFKDFNSGTYNNQWMIIDYNKGPSDSGQLYVLEQIPGQILYEDATNQLKQSGYWASYNRAFFPSVFQDSGAQDMYDRFGDWFSYERTPRAELFRSSHSTVTDKTTMYYLMRFNNYLESRESRPPGCNGSIPAAAISARSDLQDPRIGCSWSQYDLMEGRRNYGAIDVKIIDRADMSGLTAYLESGPTHFNLEPFSWSQSDGDKYEQPAMYKEVTTYNFSAFQSQWKYWTPHGAQAENQRSSSSDTRLDVVLVVLITIFLMLLLLL